MEEALVTGVTPTILAAVTGRRLFAIPAEPVIDTVGLTPHWEDDTIGPSRCSRVEIGRTVIVEVEATRPGRVPMMVIMVVMVVMVVMVAEVHVRGE
jgi:hypothetical protein